MGVFYSGQTQGISCLGIIADQAYVSQVHDITRRSVQSILVLLACTVLGCQKHSDVKIVWQRNFKSLGTLSSPKCADLNLDGVSDIVIGAGHNELEASDSTVVALDGATGKVLWASPGSDQIFGSAVLTRINGDEIPDIVIGGRAAQLKALNGVNGETIWTYQVRHHERDAKGYMRFNFYNPQLVPDQNGDDVDDLLVANGGNIHAFRESGEDRYPGVLAIISGKDGGILAADTMPDGNETYMSPLIYNYTDQGDAEILFGSGGETRGGHLYYTHLSDLLRGDISQAVAVLARDGHGFVAPPTLADLNADNHLDVVVNWHGGEMIALDGANFSILWTVGLDQTELNDSPTPGDVTGDRIPDLFTTFSIGTWPKNTGSVQVLVNGRNGEVLYQDTVGCVGFSSAISYDLDGDGSSEFIYHVNDHNCTGIYLANTDYRMLAYDHGNRSTTELYAMPAAKNIASTAWIGDLDNDNMVDLVFCIQANFADIYSFYGIQLTRMDLGVEVNSHPAWPEYMGAQSNGIF